MSSYNNSIKFSLDIEDSNIIFEDYFYRIEHGIKQKIYQAVLIPPACPYCGSVSLVHVMRNICAKVRVEDREAIMNEFKQIHQQANKAAAIDVLHAFYAKWNKSYNHVIRNLKDIEPDLLVFYNYPKQIRASIYSTNMIESFNNVIKRKAKPKAEFPTEQSLDTFIGIQAMSYNDRYFNRIHKGFGQVQDTLESYFD